VQVALALQRCQHILAHAAGLGQDRLHGILSGIRKAVGGRNLIEAHNMAQEKAELVGRCSI